MKPKKNAKFALVMCLSLALLTVAGFGQTPPEKEPLVRFLNQAVENNIPISLFHGIIYLPMKINGSGDYTFVLDTGAPVSAIDQGLAESLNLPRRDANQVRGAGRETVTLYRLDGVSLSAPGMEMSGFPFITVPLKRMEPYWGKVKHGLLGGTILSRLVTRIDYERGLLTFFPLDKYSAPADGVVIPLTVQFDGLFAKARVTPAGSGKPVEGLFFLDTGVRQTFINTPFTARNVLIAASPTKVENIIGFGIGGETRGIVGRVAALEIGGIVLSDPVVQLCTETTGLASSSQFDGIIGADILSRFRVTLDYSRKQMILEKNARFGSPFVYDMSGIYFICANDSLKQFKILNVVKDSPAAAAGLKVGDMLVSVNGAPADSFTLETLRHVFEGEGKTVELKVRRDNAVLSVSLRLKRLV